ncbi:MAG: CPBP family intramembrane metalloprotease [Clostridia bacterium]|nr:CPBP family intramembrane metalloprotease [Clostridia bacterium]
MQSNKSRLFVPLLPFCTLLFLQLSGYIDSSRLTETREAYLSFVILQLLTFVLPTIFFCKAKGDNDILRLKFRVFGLEKAVFLLFSVFVMITAMTAVELCMRNFGISGGIYAHSVYSLYGRTLGDLGGNVYDTLYTTVVFAFLPAVTEELLFRSVLFSEYESCGAPAAIFLTAALYSLLGMNVVSLFPSFAGGLLLGFSVYVTQSVFAPIIIHVCYNLYSLFFEEYIWAFISKPENEIFFTFILVTAMLLCTIMMLSQAERVIYDKGIKGQPLPAYLGATEEERQRSRAPRRGKAFILSLLSPFYIGCIVLYLLRVTGIL